MYWESHFESTDSSDPFPSSLPKPYPRIPDTRPLNHVGILAYTEHLQPHKPKRNCNESEWTRRCFRQISDVIKVCCILFGTRIGLRAFKHINCQLATCCPQDCQERQTQRCRADTRTPWNSPPCREHRSTDCSQHARSVPISAKR